MRQKTGDRVKYGREYYTVVGVNFDSHEYCLEPEDGDEVEKLGNRLWVSEDDLP